MRPIGSIRPAIVAALAAIALLTSCGAPAPEALVASARERLAKNENAAAIIDLKNALQQRRDFAEARFLLGQALLESGDAAGAETEFRKALDLRHPPAEVNPGLARALVARGQFQKAVDEYGKAETATPAGTADLQAALGQSYLALGKIEAAQMAFEKAIAARPGDARGSVGMAQIKATQGDLAGALALVDGVIATSPRMAEAYQLKARIQVAQRDTEGAIATFRKAAEINRNDVSSHASIAVLLMQQGNQEQAGKAIETMAKSAPKHPLTLYMQAELAFKQKNLPLARETIQRMLQAAPDSPRGLLLAAMIEHDLKSYPQAEAHASRVIAMAPDNPLANRVLASSYLRTGQTDRALRVLTPLLQKPNADPGVLALAGEIHLLSGRADQAERYFRQASALDPQDSRKRTGLALTHLEQGKSDQAFRELEEAAAQDGDTRADLALIATALRARQFDKALAAIDALQKKQPDKALPHTLRGTALLGKRDVAGARASYLKALEVDPNYFPAAANLARLDVLDKKPEQAKQRFEAMVERNPKNVHAWLALAEMSARNKRPAEETAGYLRKAIAANPGEVVPRRSLIAHYLREKDMKNAVQAAREAMAAMPDSTEILDLAGRAQLAAGETNQAQATFNRWAQLAPTSPVPHLRLAEVHITSKDSAAAARSLRRALEIKPDFVDAQTRLIALDIEGNRTPQALAMAREIQKQRPKEPTGYALVGDINAVKKDYPAAIAAYRAGLKEVPAPELAVKLHAALRLSNQGAEAERFGSGWLKEHPKDTMFRSYLAESSLAAGDYPGAVRQYRALLEDQPNNPAWLNNLAWASGRTKDPKALEYAEKAASLAPENAAVLDTYGMLLVESGNTARGLELLRKAATLAPERHAIRLNLAQVLIKTGDKAGARKELEPLAALGDKFPGQARVTELMKQL